MSRKDQALNYLLQICADYVDSLEDKDVPNAPVALVDDFGEWLKKWRDDQ
jgi:hypothetical protein